MPRVSVSIFAAAAALFFASVSESPAEDRFITVASTTSTANSGLFDQILPAFEAESGIQVRVVALGTGQAVRLAQNGDADVLFVHHRPSEEAFVADGYGVARHDVMYNDFVVVGPKSDPAGVDGLEIAGEALERIAAATAIFVSRGDDSGTHKKELALWKDAGLDPTPQSGTWYRELGAGMGATLNAATAMEAYSLTDRGTWLSFDNKADLAVLLEGDKQLFNPYGVILVDPARFPHAKAEDGQVFIDWLLSDEGQKAISGYRIDGQPLFFPNAEPGKTVG
jgi:tungstate transport system substrate-binding protein